MEAGLPLFQVTDIRYQVYLSVISDIDSVTITTPKSNLTSLMQRLATQGLTVKPLGLEGCFHSPLLEIAVAKISDFCYSNCDLQLPTTKQLLVPLRSHSNSKVISDGSLHETALRSIMTEMANWHLTIASAVYPLSHIDGPVAVSFGLVDSMPISIVRGTGLKVTKGGDFEISPTAFARSESVADSGTTLPILSSPQDSHFPDHAIAIVGMACKFPGAESVDAFWQVINSGASMCQEVPPERFSTLRLRRTPEQSRFWGNFINDVDAFDHRFFKRSHREAASMDPQQRLLLQVAYEAMDSSGYLGEFSRIPDDVGCYLGVCATDYDDNISSHNPTAFSSVGTLRAFLSGRISHHFGWTGPSITYDTACSSSAVAIDAACKAINLGDCSTAIAGGASIFTSPYFFQNLAAASFLSPTGATKPFDINADGYCRGEGVGLVVLRKLSTAVANKDNILSVISATAVNQNSNLTSITIPHSPSQVKLFRKVIAQAGIKPTDVSFVEAHGTGTPVGDPLEIESIREVFGGSQRLELLHVTSVKGNIGHAEGASGIAALIKTVLMMQHKTIPLQANFTALNPKIASLEADKIAIPLTSQKWDVDYKIACINNYGAAGSNASMIVNEPPLLTSRVNRQKGSLARYPIFLSANSSASLSAYCAALQTYIARLTSVSLSPETLLEDLAFNLAEKHNRSFPYTFTSTVASLSDLRDQLAATVSGADKSQLPAASDVNPLVLVFGGQSSQAIGLSKGFYNGSNIFRSYLDSCDAIIRSLGHSGLYPCIFQKEPVEDIVDLHGMLFSLQYSCAQAWMDCGLQIDAIIGHSLGQLTALTVSGSVSLEDGLKLVLGRALLMRKHWGPERGAMISLEADLDVVLSVMSTVCARGFGHKLEIACYNGPTSHVLVGARSAIKAVEEALAPLVTVQYKTLNVTHGFHSEFTDPVLLSLINLAKDLNFMEPTIPLETCSDGQSWTNIEPELIAEHTRTPVYFAQAVARLALRLGPCTWLEASSSSSVMSVLRHSLGKTTSPQHAFNVVNLSNTTAMGSLADTTVNLWKAGHKVQFWPFHWCQKSEFSHFNLPPYQFEKSRHWIEWMDKVQEIPPAELPKEESKPILLSFVRFQDQSQREGEFSVDSRSEQYRLFVQGHGVLENPLCPASMYIEVVSQAALTLRSTSEMSTSIPCIDALEMIAPIGCHSDLAIALSLRRKDAVVATWDFTLTSWSRMNGSNKTSNIQQHATGRVSLQEPKSWELNDSFARFQRLVDYRRYEDLIVDSKAEGMHGSLIYKVFGRVVHYAEYYRGVQVVSAKAHEVAGRVELPHHDLNALNDTICNPLAIDNFMQVAGLHVNCLNDCNDNEVFMSTKVDRIQLGSRYRPFGTQSWSVYSSFSPIGEKEISNDLFVFDSDTKSLVMMILGAHFTKVLITSLTKVLSRVKATEFRAKAKTHTNTSSNSLRIPNIQPENPPANALDSRLGPNSMWDGKAMPSAKPSLEHVMFILKRLISKIMEVPTESINGDYTLEELGIDSLLMIEVATEIRQTFGGNMHAAAFENVRDIRSLSGQILSNWSDDCVLDFESLTCSSSTADLSRSTPESTVTRITSLGDLPFQENNSISQLVRLVSGFLEPSVSITSDTCLVDLGLDSLLSMELASDIEKSYAVKIDITQLSPESSVGDLCDMVLGVGMPAHMAEFGQDQPKVGTLPLRSPVIATNGPISPSKPSELAIQEASPLVGIMQAFEQIRQDYDIFAKASGRAGFWKEVYPTQERLVVAYVLEAFADLGCSLALLRPGERIPQVSVLPKHNLLVGQLYEVLKNASLVLSDGMGLVRSEKMLESAPANQIYEELLLAFPPYAPEHRILHIAGAKLSECLTGAIDPLQLLFLSKENKGLMENVYVNAPMCAVITELLCSFLYKAFGTYNGGGNFNILEVGGGTGGTTKHIVDFLQHRGISFTYTFTDIAPSLVAAARKTFAEYNFMRFMILDIEKTPPERFNNHYDAIISINCIHATSNLTTSSKNLRRMLRSHGFVSLVEFTRNIFWFDLVYGLLKGWWLFNDGRKHALANETFWADSMRAAGFKHISWTDGKSLEARTIRIITGFMAEPESPALIPRSTQPQQKAHMETLVYRQTGGTILCADVYYPAASEVSKGKRPVGTISQYQYPIGGAAY